MDYSTIYSLCGDDVCMAKQNYTDNKNLNRNYNVINKKKNHVQKV